MEATIARALQVLIALSGAYLAALWVVLIVWTYRDIETRSRSVVTQVFSSMLSALFFVPGVLLYMMLGPKETLDLTFQRSLEEEYLLQDIEASAGKPISVEVRARPHRNGEVVLSAWKDELFLGSAAAPLSAGRPHTPHRR